MTRANQKEVFWFVEDEKTPMNAQAATFNIPVNDTLTVANMDGRSRSISQEGLVRSETVPWPLGQGHRLVPSFMSTLSGVFHV
jgi:hypothetical protein